MVGCTVGSSTRNLKQQGRKHMGFCAVGDHVLIITVEQLPLLDCVAMNVCRVGDLTLEPNATLILHCS